MSAKVMRIKSGANGRVTRFDGQWVVSHDPDRFKLITTPHKKLARVFNGANEAFEYWLEQSTRTPLRPDGKPNRPLTAFSVLIEDAEP